MAISGVGSFKTDTTHIDKTNAFNSTDNKTLHIGIEESIETDELTMPIDEKVAKNNLKYNNGGIKIPIIYQNDYPDVKVGDTTIADGGCGYTACAMVATYLSGELITPADIAEWGQDYYIPKEGMDWELIPAVAKHYDLGEVTQKFYIEDVLKSLEEGKPVICAQDKGAFTDSGHIIVLRGIDENGNILVNDPNIENAEGKGFNNKTFTIDEIREGAVSYWIFEGEPKNTETGYA